MDDAVIQSLETRCNAFIAELQTAISFAKSLGNREKVLDQQEEQNRKAKEKLNAGWDELNQALEDFKKAESELKKKEEEANTRLRKAQEWEDRLAILSDTLSKQHLEQERANDNG